MAVNPTIKKAYWTLVAAGVAYFACLGLLTIGSVQRWALYANHVTSPWWRDSLNIPEKVGFMRNQVRSFHLNTSDGERLHGWHILPVGLYFNHQTALEQEDSRVPYEESLAFRLLTEDSKARLVLSFHGNAGTLSQGHRPAAYRALSSSSPHHGHVWTIDYRGYGYSTGSPTEAGLVTDGVTLASYALDAAKISSNRIVIQGQSLGTAVGVAVAEHFVQRRSVDFKAVVLVAAFEDLPKLMATYAIGGVFPILSPLAPYPKLARVFERRISETWESGRRLVRLVKTGREVNIYLVHARNDFEIPWTHSEALFRIAANATTDGESGMSRRQIDAAKIRRDLGPGGWVDVWKAGQGAIGSKNIRLEVVSAGGHNEITTLPVVGKAVADAFEGVV